MITESIQYWIDISEYDLQTAQAMLDTQRFLYVGFMCHQNIEKILKAYYIHKINNKPPYTHNLSYLAEQSGLMKLLSEEHKSLMDILESLNIEARYPKYKDNLLKSLTFEKCKSLLHDTGEFHKWIKILLLT